MPTDVKPKNYTLGHESQSHGHGIGIPESNHDNMNKSGAGKSASQPSGHSIGVPTQGGKERWSGGIDSPGSSGGIFKTRGSVLRNSGVAGAHRVGGKKK